MSSGTRTSFPESSVSLHANLTIQFYRILTKSLHFPDTSPRFAPMINPMEKIFVSILALTSIALSPAIQAGLPGLITARHVDWSFIESVGGMKVNFDKRELSVSCNVSGTEEISNKPTMVNSGIGVRKLKLSRAGSTIRLAVVTSVLEKGISPKCGNVDLSKYPAGTYTVVYLNPDGTTHPLGSVVIP